MDCALLFLLRGCRYLLFILSSWSILSYDSIFFFLLSNADCSPATLHFRIAVFVKPTPPSSLRPSRASTATLVSSAQSPSETLQSWRQTRRLIYNTYRSLRTLHNVWWWEIVLGREPPWSRVSAGALLNGTCLMGYDLLGDLSDILVHRPGSTCYSQREGLPHGWRRSLPGPDPERLLMMLSLGLQISAPPSGDSVSLSYPLLSFSNLVVLFLSLTISYSMALSDGFTDNFPDYPGSVSFSFFPSAHYPRFDRRPFVLLIYSSGPLK